MKKISILMPAYNESGNLKAMVGELDSLTNSGLFVIENIGQTVNLNDYEWEYVFVNDGSKDNTLQVLRSLRQDNARVNIVNLSRNFGKENALLAGMDYASGDAVIIMDADLQHPVTAIPEMIYWWTQGYDDVYGRRSDRGRESWLRKRLSLMFYSMLQSSTRIEILQNVGDFRLLDRRAIDAIRSLRETQRYTKGLYCWVGYNKKEFLFKQGDRLEGKSSFNFRGLLNLAIEGITCFTTAPLRLSAIMGFIASFIALIYIIIVLIKTIFWGEPVQGYPTIICTILFFSGIQLIALGITGEYIGRIFNETKRRPPYIVESFNETKL
ncbi:MAG: glycosyltransferase family 2 protein [Bacteroides sp.]|nr:glycosyltransferase family 2 protein [Bacteroidales bacterium]MBD5327719.1 glycosyltransferase family 2 protein [Bacteroides sp.]MBD5415039.1 glycosyltransferase family 2 protein [Bacteroides sp.]MDE6222392.1 glycosyltransferase family 2 protein [Muribaculaceae bacterium]